MMKNGAIISAPASNHSADAATNGADAGIKIADS